MSAPAPLPGPDASLLDAALAYAARGWPVLPLHEPVSDACTCGWSPSTPDAGCRGKSIGKHPRTRHGKDDASTDPSVIRAWWREWPTANVGLATTSFLVIDVDGFVGEVSLEDLIEDHGALPPTLEARTGGGGRHLIYRHPAGEPIKNKVAAAEKLDTRSHGGHIVAAPSLHASGRRYEWADPGAPIADLGDHGLVALLRAAKRPGPSAAKPLPPAPRVEGHGTDRDLARARGILRAACERIAALTDGRRAALISESHKVGGYLWTGLGFEEAEAALVDAGRRSGTKHDPYRVVRYGLDTGKNAPLALPPDDDPPRGTRQRKTDGPRPQGRQPEPPIDIYEDEATQASPEDRGDASSPGPRDTSRQERHRSGGARKGPPTRPGVLQRLERTLELFGLADADTRAQMLAGLHGEVDELAAAWADHESEIRGAFTRLRSGRGNSVAAGEILRLVIKAAERLAGAARQTRQAASTPHDIRLGPDLDRVEEETIAAIAARDDGVYQRSAQLVQVVEDRLVPVDRWHLRTRLTRVARFLQSKGDGAVAHVSPPIDLVQGVLARRSWRGIRPITAVVREPILRPDGTVLQAEGYDTATATIYAPTQAWPAVPAAPELEDAQESAARLLEVVGAFPVASGAALSAWLAAVLTPLARFAFTGPAPWFLWTANVRGTGKSLMASVAAIIATGDDPAATSAPDRDEEMRKILTSCAVAAKRLVLLDNLVGDIGWPSLDAVLTSSRHGDRILGSSTQIDVPMTTVWYGTANSPVFRADTSRRVLPIPLDSGTPNPEHRRFRIGDLKGFVRARRAELAVDALTILRAYSAAGRPEQDLPAWGSYEGWSALVRGAIVWLGYPDPAATTEGIGEIDLGQQTLERLLAAIWSWRRDRTWTVAELQADLAQDNLGALGELEGAVQDLTESEKFSRPKVGKRLIRLRGRMVNVDNRVLRFHAVKDRHTKAWTYRVCEPAAK